MIVKMLLEVFLLEQQYGPHSSVIIWLKTQPKQQLKSHPGK